MKLQKSALCFVRCKLWNVEYLCIFIYKHTSVFYVFENHFTFILNTLIIRKIIIT